VTLIPENLALLHRHEEKCRERALAIVGQNTDLQLHLQATEAAMEIADQLRKVANEDEDFKFIRLFSMRIFNAFGSATALVMRGYGQGATMILRDVIETSFLIDYFASNPSELTRWRTCDDKTRRRDFSPFEIRKALDKRDGFIEGKRDAEYRLYSELAAHASTQSAAMLRPRPSDNAVSGPFIEATALDAVVSEMGKRALLAGGTLAAFLPRDHAASVKSRQHFYTLQRIWFEHFYGKEAIMKVATKLKNKSSPTTS